MYRAVKRTVAPLAGAIALLHAGTGFAASCCGGGGSSSLVMPKFNNQLYAASFDIEHYNGVWRDDGEWEADPADYKLYQFRLNLGYARRLASRWQGSVNVPLVYNSNHYDGISSDTYGFGDTTIAALYETFDNITCTYAVNSIADLRPAVYLGLGMILPTGVSPYDDVENNFDITGRGFYRLDATVIAEKTVFPWNAGVYYTYGYYLERPVNREYGRYVEPYDKQLGARKTLSVSFGRNWQTSDFDTWTGTIAYADMREEESRIDGHVDPTSGLQKRSISATAAWANASKSWVIKMTWSHAPHRDDWGKNFPTTDIVTLGVTHVL